MQCLQTPDERFDNLPGYNYAPHYAQVADGDGGTLRMHYVDEGPESAQVILCLHGQPTWSYLYRKMIPLFVARGYRVIAPDLVGFGRSDKPRARSDYSYARHVAWLGGLLDTLKLQNVTLVCQDWGGLIGLRVVAEQPDRFARIVVANTGLPDADGVADEQVQPLSERMRSHYASVPIAASAQDMGTAMASDATGMGFLHWVKFCAESSAFRPSEVVGFSTGGQLSAAELAAYDAPFPADEYLSGAREFPSLVPIMPDNPAIAANRAAWKVLEQWHKPLLTAFSDSDPITAGGDVRFRDTVPGAQGQSHTTLKGAGHFLQEQVPGQLVNAVVRFIAAN